MNLFKNKTVLITGATGLIGSHLIKRLMQFPNVHIIALGRSLEKLETVFDEFLTSENLNLVEQDIAIRKPFLSQTVDFIFHAASPIAGNVIHTFPVNVILPNINGLINCLEFLKVQKESMGVDGRLIVFSSATVYRNLSDIDRLMNEGHTEWADGLDSLNAPYSESKRMCEVIAEAYHRQYNINVLIARLGYLYGYSKFAADTAFYEFIDKVIAGHDIELNNCGMPRRDNIYIDDAISGLLCLCEKGESGEVYNVSSGSDKDNYAAIDEIAECMVEIANKEKLNGKIQILYKTLLQTKRKPGIILNNEKLKSLGWQIEYNLEEGIKRTLKTYMNTQVKKSL